MKLILNIDNIQVIVRPLHKTIYQVLNYLYYKVPHFCFNKKLFISGNCRMCIIEVSNMPKPVVSCALPVSNNLIIMTKTPFVSKARENILEFLLNNHPLDCPVCDQGGECDLQELSKSQGSGTSRFFFEKNTTAPKNIHNLISTSMNRCINCTKCVRLAFYIGVNTMSSVGRSINSQIFNFKSTDTPKNIFLVSSLVEICPVGLQLTKETNTLLLALYMLGLPVILNLLIKLNIFYGFFICFVALCTTTKKYPTLSGTIIVLFLAYLSNGFYLILMSLKALSLLLNPAKEDNHLLRMFEPILQYGSVGVKFVAKKMGLNPKTAATAFGTGGTLVVANEYSKVGRLAVINTKASILTATSNISASLIPTYEVGSIPWRDNRAALIHSRERIETLAKEAKNVEGVVYENLQYGKGIAIKAAETAFGF